MARTIPYFGLLWVRFPVFLDDVLVCESFRFRLEHVRDLPLTHAYLIPYGYKARGKVHIVLPQQGDSHHDVINIMKYKSAASRILCLRFDKRNWMISPMPTRIEMVGRMIAIIETMTVGLCA